MKLEKIDQENIDFYDEVHSSVQNGELTIKEILGFEIDGAAVFIPRVPCAHINPTKMICESAEDSSSSSVFSLAPIYDTLIYPIDNGFEGFPINVKTFKEFNNISLEDFLVFVEKKRIIPYFPIKYRRYDEDFIRHFLEPGLPRISDMHLQLMLLMNQCNVIERDCKKCEVHNKTALQDIRQIRKNEDEEIIKNCSQCLQALYTLGINRENLLKSSSPQYTLCALKDIVISRNMNAVVKTNCDIAKNALGIFSGFSDSSQALDSIIEGLKVSYSNEIDITSYLEFLDGKTTKAVRQIIKKIMEEPYAMKYSERINAKLCDLNKEIEEIGKSRAAKFYQAVSDIAVYGGSKYVEAQSGTLIKPERRDLHKTSEWIASRLLDIHAKVTKKDWTLAQIYKTRTKIEKCKEPPRKK